MTARQPAFRMTLARATQHRSGQPFLTQWTPDKVANAPDPVVAFAEYAQQTLGTPWPTLADMKVLRKKANELFERQPGADYYTLCRIVLWAKKDRRRYTRVWQVIDSFRYAYRDGALPELDPSRRVDDDTEARIARALETETDPQWRARLIATQGIELRRRAYADWQSHHHH